MEHMITLLVVAGITCSLVFAVVTDRVSPKASDWKLSEPWNRRPGCCRREFRGFGYHLLQVQFVQVDANPAPVARCRMFPQQPAPVGPTSFACRCPGPRRCLSPSLGDCAAAGCFIVSSHESCHCCLKQARAARCNVSRSSASCRCRSARIHHGKLSAQLCCASLDRTQYIYQGSRCSA